MTVIDAINHYYADRGVCEQDIFACPDEFPNQLFIAREVGVRVAREMGEFVSYGTFYNLREHGLTYTVLGPDLHPENGWTFCVYEHRNSDEIIINGCRTAEVKPYGPYGGQDKWDTLGCFDYGNYDDAANALIRILNLAMEFGDDWKRHYFV